MATVVKKNWSNKGQNLYLKRRAYPGNNALTRWSWTSRKDAAEDFVNRGAAATVLSHIYSENSYVDRVRGVDADYTIVE